MKTTGKAKVIKQAFFEGKNVSDDIHKYRLEICKKCEHNSANIDDSDLSLISRLRKKMAPSKNFCQHCGCYIVEKTGQALEQCDLDNPKWNKVALIIENKENFNLHNLSHDTVNLELENNQYVVNVGDFTYVDGISFSLEVELKKGFGDTIRVVPGCSLCTDVKVKRSKNNRYILDITLKNINKGDMVKRIYVYYNYGENKSKEQKSVIKMTGNAY